MYTFWCLELSYHSQFPHGFKVIVHNKLIIYLYWAPNESVRFTLSVAHSHYCCIRYYFTKLRLSRSIDTVTFIPHTIPIPKIFIDALFPQASSNIISILQKYSFLIFIPLKSSDQINSAHVKLATIFKQVDKYLTLSIINDTNTRQVLEWNPLQNSPPSKKNQMWWTKNSQEWSNINSQHVTFQGWGDRWRINIHKYNQKSHIKKGSNETFFTMVRRINLYSKDQI